MSDPTPASDASPAAAAVGDGGPVSHEYLLTEFRTAWAHLGGLETKRLVLFLGYGLVSALLLLAWTLSRGAWSAGAAAAWLVVVSAACRMIARSERLAAERYRNKINLLRRTLLQGIDSARLWDMQRSGAAWALQVDTNPPKALHLSDLLRPPQWNTALFMKATYDAGVVLGAVLVLAELRRLA